MKVNVYSFGFLYQGNSLTVLFARAAIFLKNFIIYLTTYLYKPGPEGFVLTLSLAL